MNTDKYQIIKIVKKPGKEILIYDWDCNDAECLEDSWLMVYGKECGDCERELLCPVTDVVFRCFLEYVSPAGRNYYSDSYVFVYEQIDELLGEIENDDKRRETRAYQRSLMTPSLRYDVMKRDGFKCVLCGRTAVDGVKLHVDHILPVCCNRACGLVGDFREVSRATPF